MGQKGVEYWLWSDCQTMSFDFVARFQVIRLTLSNLYLTFRVVVIPSLGPDFGDFAMTTFCCYVNDLFHNQCQLFGVGNLVLGSIQCCDHLSGAQIRAVLLVVDLAGMQSDLLERSSAVMATAAVVGASLDAIQLGITDQTTDDAD